MSSCKVVQPAKKNIIGQHQRAQASCAAQLSPFLLALPSPLAQPLSAQGLGLATLTLSRQPHELTCCCAGSW